MRLLIYAINGKGMGHLNRTSILARALREVAPDTEVAFLAGSPLYGMLADMGFEVVKVPDRHHPLGHLAGMNQRPTHMAALFRQLLEYYRPDVFLTDFALNPTLFRDAKQVGARIAVVLRKQRTFDMLKLAVAPAIRSVDRLLLPHSEDEWPRQAMPVPLRSRSVYLGNVVRGLDHSLVPSVRARYAAPLERLVVVTIGGGGYTEAHPLLQVAEQAAMMPGANPSSVVRWVIVYGPYYPFEIPTTATHSNIVRIRYEANMPELLLAADVVVSNAGYNTISELETCGTPAVVVPRTTRGRDDQVERAQAFVKSGRGVISPEQSAAVSGAVRSILEHGSVARMLATGEEDNQTYRRTLGLSVLNALQQ